MRYIQWFIYFVLILFLSACQNDASPSLLSPSFAEQGIAEIWVGFPSASLQSGSDEQYSLRQLRSYRLSDGSLRLQLGGWGITEMGIMLWSERKGETLRFRLMHFCGTVGSITHEKVNYDYPVAPAVEDSLSRIVFIASQDSLVLEKTLAGEL